MAQLVERGIWIPEVTDSSSVVLTVWGKRRRKFRKGFHLSSAPSLLALLLLPFGARSRRDSKQASLCLSSKGEGEGPKQSLQEGGQKSPAPRERRTNKLASALRDPKGGLSSPVGDPAQKTFPLYLQRQN